MLFSANSALFFGIIVWLGQNAKPVQGTIRNANSKVDYPFFAFLKNVKNYGCHAMLISKNYLVARASFIDRFQKNGTKIYMGYKSNPAHPPNLKRAQIFELDEIIVHPYFLDMKKNYLNNIALIKLNREVTNIRPAVLAGNIDIYSLVDNEDLSVVGYYRKVDSPLKSASVRLREQYLCNAMYSNLVYETQQVCILWNKNELLTGLGNALVLPNKAVLGYRVPGIPCPVKEIYCNSREIFVNLGPFIEWISTYTEVTTEYPEKTDSHTSCDDLKEEIENMKYDLAELKAKHTIEMTAMNFNITRAIKVLKSERGSIRNAENNLTMH